MWCIGDKGGGTGNNTNETKERENQLLLEKMKNVVISITIVVPVLICKFAFKQIKYCKTFL